MFKNNLEDEKALTPLKKAVQNGKLGSLTVDPESLKIKKDVKGNRNKNDLRYNPSAVIYTTDILQYFPSFHLFDINIYLYIFINI